ncbi:MAG: alpha/beta fold hydrolase [Betaproteobacteria bacterium]|jgi:alpha/beta superfamily hydrolase
MNSATQTMQLQGPAGILEGLCDVPEGGAFKGTVVISHPHPLFGGTMQNKVVQTLAKAFVQNGWRAIRFNFRGVGASEGAYDEGRGEVDDLISMIEATCEAAQPMALAGFSFGAYVTSQAVARLSPSNNLEKLVFIGTAASRFQVAPVPAELHDKTLVVHGELDDTVPLASVLDWARPQSLPVTVIPGVEHFFHGQLPLLRTLISRHLRT